MINLILLIALLLIPKSIYSNEPKVVGYYPSWAIYRTPVFKPRSIDTSLITHINYAFAKVDINGNILLVDPWADTDYRANWNSEKPFWGNFEQLLQLKKENKNLKTLISIGGWTLSDNFSVLAANPKAREHFAKQAVQFCRTYGFDGIDIDWEYPGFAEHSGRPQDKENYTLLLAELSKTLKPAKLLLTIAAPAGSWHYQNMELDKIHPYLDWINLMAYDLHGAWGDSDNPVTNHQAALYSPAQGNPDLCIHNAVLHYLSQGVPREKMVIGLPLYGRVYAESEGLYSSYKGPGAGTTEEKGVRFFYDIKNNFHYDRCWDDFAQASYLYDPYTKEFVSFDDEETLQLKGRYIKEMGLGGAMVWELGQDLHPTWDAMKAINEGLK